MNERELVALAAEARSRSYCPYSGYAVGAALLCEDGTVYLGCNIENASFTPTVCAERTAFFKAISDGKRSFTRIAVVGGRRDEPAGFAPPCGVCRQVMSEFVSDNFTVILTDGDKIFTYTLDALLPNRFRPESL